jgi:MFS family permease
MTMSAVNSDGDWSYWRVLRSGRVGVLLTGDMISNVGDGMLITVLPLLTLRIHGDVPPALAISAVEAAPYVLATVLAFTIGLSRIRIPPRALLVCDCLLRSILFVLLGVLALTGALTLWTLAGGLLVGSVFRMVAMSSRRLVATGLVESAGRFAVNGLLGTSSGLALYAVGPLIGGILSTAADPGVALLVDGLSFVVLLLAVCFAVPSQPGSVAGETIPPSGWQILRRTPVAARLFVVVFCFNLFYMPLDIALPLLVRGPLQGNGTALGLIWAGFGIGTLIGAMGTNLLRRIPPQKLLVTIIAAWGGVMLLVVAAPSVPFAATAFFLGGLLYAPFTPVAYTFVQSVLQPDQQQSVVTLWSARSVLAAPIGLALAGPLVNAAGSQGGLIVSALLTLALVPVATLRLRAVTAPEEQEIRP